MVKLEAPLDSNGGIPKTSSVARSNSLRSVSPPRMRRDHHKMNLPPTVPEEEPSLASIARLSARFSAQAMNLPTGTVPHSQSDPFHPQNIMEV